MNLRKAAFAATAALCLPSAAFASAEAVQPVNLRVETGDLDLASTTGKARLELRTHNAIARACAPRNQSYAEREDAQRCRAEMRTNADAKLAALTGGSASQMATVE
ncbi:UrcA family protein [Sphingomonas sp. ID0503]|uniref:UrcA family protein n=1 Tax=Sphingomonas sp. ID0503 TaxID=3399691 RepID=UPI003AFA6F1F